ncbi:MAG: Secretion protein HlyD family protein [Gammaproteobacteria bacterium]|nr:MAG: Secretion protein HlyD family protein [Gammaproteobacteria bacterium]TND05538.1 MAG: Secretion protein HlyD family protein [Gammaproteobacteria bacterium]
MNASLRAAWVTAEGKVETMPGFDVDLGTGELSGRIAKILVKPGDQVEKGQIVIVLDNADLQAQVQRGEQELVVAERRLTEIKSGARTEEILALGASLDGANARMEEAQHQLDRNRELHTKNMASQAMIDEREAALKSAQAAVKELNQRKKLLEEGAKPETVQRYRAEVGLAKAALDYDRKRLEKTIIRSPITGTVIERYMDEGEGVTPEIPILAIADLTKIWINAEVDETDGGRIHVDDIANVSSNAYPGTTFSGTIREIADYAGTRKIRPSNPAINLGLKVVQVKIGLQERSPLRLGMTVDVRITPGGSQGGAAKE